MSAPAATATASTPPSSGDTVDPKAPRRRHRRVPLVQQMEETECGAASLAMVLASWGCWVPLEELREACGVSRDGANALSVLRAARTYGLVASGGKATVEELRAASTPSIVFWRNSHFLVVQRFRRSGVDVVDPAGGPRHVDDKEFAASYSGVALWFAPGPGFDGSRRRPSLVGSLWRLLVHSRRAVFMALFIGLLLVVPGVVTPVLLSSFVDGVLLATTPSWFGTIVVAYLAMLALIGVLTLVQQSVLLRLQTKLSVKMTAGFLWHLLLVPVGYFEARFPGGLVQRVQVNDQVAQMLSGQLATTLVGLTTMVLFAVVMSYYSVTLTLIGVGVALTNALVLWFVARVNVLANREALQAQVRQSGQAFSGLSSITNLIATGAEDEFFARWAGEQSRALGAEQRQGRIAQSLAVVPVVLGMVNTVVILVVGGLLVIDGDLTIGTLVAFQGLMASFLAPITSLVVNVGQYQGAFAQLQQLNDVLDYDIDPLASDPTLQRKAPNPVPPSGALRGHLELRGLTFGYNPTAPPLIDGFDLVVEPGQRVALVGSSGSGKSTIANLVVGLLTPWSGEVLLDGQPRDSWPRSVVTTSVTKVDQKIFLFQGTVSDNLRLWDDAIPAAQLQAAAVDADIHDEIMRRANGYATVVAEGGTNFSGGQAQRLEIARALAVNPSLLILDEATSALDAEVERRIDDALRRRGLTCLIVAHRLSTIRDCDEIVVLDHGRVVGRGTHDHLLATCPPYAALVQDE